jgi:hypothetical protein
MAWSSIRFITVPARVSPWSIMRFTNSIARISRISELLNEISLIRFKIPMAVVGTSGRPIGLTCTITTSRLRQW